MKNRGLQQVIIFMLLPVLTGLLALVSYFVYGAPYFAGNWDPQYTYLMNSASLAQGREITHFWHPGTPVNIFGSFLVQAFYHIAPQSISSVSLDESILTYPDWYLARINLFWGFIKVILHFTLGLVSYRALGNIWLALTAQLIPLFSLVTIRYGFTQAAPEAFVFIVCIALFTALIHADKYRKSESYRYAVLFGVICGFGFAGKLIFGPLLAIPFLFLRGWKQRTVLLCSFLLSYVTLLYPIFNLSNFKMAYQIFFVNILVNKGRYGFGEAGIDYGFIWENFKAITGISLGVWISPMLSLIALFKFQPRNFAAVNRSRYYEMLIGSLFAVSISMLYIVNNFRDRYMIAALCAAGFMVYLSLGMIWRSREGLAAKTLAKYSFAIIATLLFYINALAATITKYLPLKQVEEGYIVNKILQERYHNYGRVHFFDSNTLPLALCYSQYYAEDYFMTTLNNIYPDDYISHVHNNGEITDFAKQPYSPQELMNKYAGKVIMIGTPRDKYAEIQKEFFEPHFQGIIGFPVVSTMEAYRGETIAIYEIVNAFEP